jgi:uncharacterized protein with ParB-like and HNH nuclease domain
MKADAIQLLKFLRNSPQLSIPIFQRTYSWPFEQCQQLWNDIIRVGQNAKVNAHFIGSIVYVEKDLSSIANPSSFLVIDGQQRLTTSSILLEALARAVGDAEPEDGFSAAKIRHYYLVNPLESGDRRHKLLLSQNDKNTLLALAGQQPIPANPSVRVIENFDFFTQRIADLKGNFKALCQGLSKLMIVEVVLQRGQDNPQLIFESMNSTGLALSQADLIRNYVLMDHEQDEQTRLYHNYWRPMEELFGQEAYIWAFDPFMRHYLTFKTRNIPNIGDVYREFKAYLSKSELRIETVLEDVYAHAGYYAAMALDKETDPELASAFGDLRDLKVDVAYPLLLELYQDYDQKRLARADFIAAVRLVEAYVLRRAVCAVPTNTLNKTFASFAQPLDKSNYIESIGSRFAGLTGRYRLPDDVEFSHGLRNTPLYGRHCLKLLLRHLENQGRKEPVSVVEYTIEHILPQHTELSEAWRADLGTDWKNVQATWLHTLGNLTLTGYNPEYSDRPFQEKRDMPGGFAHSPLRLNVGLGQLSAWNEETIKSRANRLAEQALAIWPLPNLSAIALAELSAVGGPVEAEEDGE